MNRRDAMHAAKTAGQDLRGNRVSAVKSWPPFSASVSYMATLLLGLFLLFYNLDSHLLWGDEAETATLARNVMRFGVPKTFDGVNRISIYGSKNDANAQGIWTWSPWLQEYVAAGSFCLFGPTTWAARAPFALIAWFSLGLMAFVTYQIYRDHRMALASLVLLATSEVFLLHARQCRYYSMSVGGEILLMYGLYLVLAGKHSGSWMLAGALILQFYANYILAAANVPVLLPLAWTVFRRNKREVLPMVFAGALFAMAALPWLLYAQPWHQKGALGPEHHLAKILLYFREFHFHFLPWIFVLLPIGAWASARWKSRSKDSTQAVETTAASQQKQSPAEPAQAFTGVLRQFEWRLILLIPIFMVVISVAPGRFTRYQLPLVPIACVLMAAWTIRHVRWPAAAIGLLVVACTSSFLAFVSGYPFRGEEHTLRWTLPRFSVGITKPYTDRFADVVAFFNQEAKPGDEAFVFDPEFPLIFYTRLRIVDGRLLAGLPDRMPEWMLPESPSGVAEQVPGPLPDLLKPYYDAVRIPVHNSTRRGSIPDPDNYEYRTPETMSTFSVFRKKRQEPGQ